MASAGGHGVGIRPPQAEEVTSPGSSQAAGLQRLYAPLLCQLFSLYCGSDDAKVTGVLNAVYAIFVFQESAARQVATSRA